MVFYFSISAYAIHGIFRASVQALMTINALMLETENNLWLWFYQLRVVAPFTPKITPFEENGCSYPGSVIERKPLKLEDQCRLVTGHRNLLRVMNKVSLIAS
jgi:hypothetical protein